MVDLYCQRAYHLVLVIFPGFGQLKRTTLFGSNQFVTYTESNVKELINLPTHNKVYVTMLERHDKIKKNCSSQMAKTLLSRLRLSFPTF